MNMREKKGKLWFKLTVIAGIAALCFTGCGSGANAGKGGAARMDAEYATDAIYEESYPAEEAVTEEAAAEEVTGENGTSVAANRKLIKRVNMNVETEEFDRLTATVQKKIEALGGYIESMSLYNGSSYYGETTRTAYMVIRIPKDKLDEFVTEVAENSNVISRDENTQDVTIQYVDLESHKKALEIEQERLLDLLTKAETMEDIIALEQRLSEVRYELESMESQLRTYDNLVDFSTINLDINEVEKLTPVEEVSAFDRMTEGFAASFGNLVEGVKDFFIGLVIFLPYIIFWGLLITGIALLVRGIVRKNNKRAEKKQKKIQEKYRKQPEEKGGQPQLPEAEKEQTEKNDK